VNLASSRQLSAISQAIEKDSRQLAVSSQKEDFEFRNCKFELPAPRSPVSGHRSADKSSMYLNKQQQVTSRSIRGKIRSSIGFPTMHNPIDDNALAAINYSEQNPVIPDSQAIASNTSKFLNLTTARVCGQLFNTLQNEATLLGRDATQVPLNASVVGKAIHALDEALAFQAAKQLSVRDRPSTRPDGSFQITDVLAILN